MNIPRGFSYQMFTAFSCQMMISGMFYERNIRQTRKVQVTADNRMVPDPCRCENDGICDSTHESFAFITTGEDSNILAYRYNQAPDFNLMDNT